MDALVARIEASGQTLPGRPSTIWLEDADHLPIAVQHQLRDWIEFDAPPGRWASGPLHWVAGAGDASELEIEPGLDPRLEEALSVLDLRIPPLDERIEGIEAFVTATASSWLAARGQAPRRFGPDAIALLESRPWPGNLRELANALESTVVRSGPNELRIDGLTPRTHPRATREGGPRECEELSALLVECGGNVSRVARRLGRPRSTVRSRISKLGLNHLLYRN